MVLQQQHSFNQEKIKIKKNILNASVYNVDSFTYLKSLRITAESCVNLFECCTSKAADASSTLMQSTVQTHKKTSIQEKISI